MNRFEASVVRSMGKKYWLALANLIWLGCWPASMVHASTEQAVVASPSIQHDWYQNEVAEQARHELEQQLQEAVLAQHLPQPQPQLPQLPHSRNIRLPVESVACG